MKRTSFAVPQSRRTIGDVVRDIAALPVEQQPDAIRRGGQNLRHLLRFCYDPTISIDLPRGELHYQPISVEAFSRWEEPTDDMDLLAGECPRLVRLFATGHGRHSSSRRLQIWRDVIERLQPEDVQILETIRRFRRIDGISREVCVTAGVFDKPLAKAVSAESIAYLSSGWAPDTDAPRVLAQQPTPPPATTSEASAHYDRLYSRLKFG